ncbi:MAG: hypothetical protein K0S78_3891 [Thermomicrobiales bacterium]|jgi:hypothetical protein|nr:hypothetical protein [Thermomicrobiales bacterium]
MTPRALITTIGATALAISVAAEGSFSDATATDPGSQRLAAWNDPCVIAV